MILAFEDYELDDERCELRHKDRRVALQPKAFALLLHLVRNRARVVAAAADYFSLAYSACACARTGTSRSASFHKDRNSSYAAFAPI